MELKELQKKLREFELERGWDRFPASLIFAHLVEELGEISRHITVQEGYKIVGLGHEAPDPSQLPREFAQVFALFTQLASHFRVDLEASVLSELEIMAERFDAKKWSEHMENRES
jgi:NTP pyrophosphatase (non-canonical NTP hydrolase)